MKQDLKNNITDLSVFTFSKMQPHNKNIEQAILSAILIETYSITEISGLITESDFYYTNHKEVYKAAMEMYLNNENIDIFTISAKLKRAGKLDEVGGELFICELSNIVSSVAHTTYHCYILKELGIKRKLIAMSAELARKAFDDTIDAIELFGDANKVFDEIVTNISKAKEPNFNNSVDEVLDSMEFASKNGYVQGLGTFIDSIDRMSNGLNQGNLIIIGGKPGQGKTTLALQFALNQAIKRKIPIGFFSLEMTANELIKKIISNFFEIDNKQVNSGGLKGEQWQLLRQNIETIKKSPFFISDTGASSLLQLKTLAKNWKMKHNIQAIYIDHLQLMTLEGINVKEKALTQRTHQIGYMCNQLKALAKELNIPIILLSQMSRASDGRSDKKPMLSDLRESGDIEAAADVVMFPYREDYYEKNNEEIKGFVELIFAKNRMGECGTVNLEFTPQYSKFSEWLKPLPMIGKSNYNENKRIDTPF
jgi:replicative DNA helicase